MQRVVRVFDEVAAVYDEVLPFFRGFATELVAAIAPAPGTRLLDLAAGAGAITERALARGCVVTAVDAAPAMIARIAAEHPGATAMVMDIHRLDFPSGAFDVVTAGFVMHLVDDPAAVAREAQRVLAPAGRFVFTVPGPPADPAAPLDTVNQLFSEFTQYLPAGGSMGATFDAIRLLADAGFADMTQTHLQVEFTVPDAETLWRWLHSHGTRAFLDDLPPARRADFHRRLIEALDTQGEFILARTALVYTGYAVE